MKRVKPKRNRARAKCTTRSSKHLSLRSAPAASQLKAPPPLSNAWANMFAASHVSPPQLLVQPLLNESQAAQYLNTSTKFLRNDRWKGARIPFIKIGGSVKYDLRELDAYIAAHKVGGQK